MSTIPEDKTNIGLTVKTIMDGSRGKPVKLPAEANPQIKSDSNRKVGEQLVAVADSDNQSTARQPTLGGLTRRLLRGVKKNLEGNPGELLPGNEREALQTILETAFLDRDSWEFYLTQLAIVYNAQYDPKNLEVASDELSERIVSKGLSSLSNQELANLAINPVQLMQLNDAINEDDRLDEVWSPLKTEVGEHLLAEQLGDRKDTRTNS